MAIHDCVLQKFRFDSILDHFPPWLLLMGQSLTFKLRELDHLIASKGFKKRQKEENLNLSVEEQGKIYQLIKEHQK